MAKLPLETVSGGHSKNDRWEPTELMVVKQILMSEMGNLVLW